MIRKLKQYSRAIHSFVGDFSDAPQFQNECKKILHKNGITESKVIVQPAAKKGENYQSITKRVLIENSTGNQNFQMFVKIASNDKERRTISNTAAFFKNECFVFEELLPNFDKLQNEFNIPADQKLKYPKYYGGNSSSDNEILFFEDLSVLDYKTPNKFQFFTLAETKMGLEFLAKFHGLSYALRNKYPYKYEELKQIPQAPFKGKSEQLITVYNNILNNTIEYIDNPKSKTVLEYISKRVDDIIISGLERTEEGNEKHVFIHGDFHPKNTMFKINDGVTEKLIVIDYQLVRNALPLFDVITFILLSTNGDFRTKHYIECIDFYYETIEKFLEKFHISIDDVYRKSKFHDDVKENSKFVMVNMMMYNAIHCREDKDLIDQDELMKDMKKSVTNVMGPKSRKRYQKAINDMINTFLENGYLNI